MASPESNAGAEKMLAFLAEVKRIHQHVMGRELEAYKTTDAACLVSVFDALWKLDGSGTEFVAQLLHRLVWAQCLENANHRTSILFLQSFLTAAGVAFPWYQDAPDAAARFEANLNGWSNRSKALLRRRGEPGYAQARLGPETSTSQGRGWSKNLGLSRPF